MTARWSLLALASVLALGATARAETVDWSQYIDKNPSAPIAKAPAPKATTPAAKAKPAAASRPAVKVAAKPKPKPRAKPGHR